MSYNTDKLPPVHPGDILLHECLEPLGLTQSKLAQDIGLSTSLVNNLVHKKQSINADIALRLGKYFGISAEFWMNIQNDYDLETAKDRLQNRLEKEVIARAA